jgi:hypothetical protein
MEPWLFLPGLLVCILLFILLHQWVVLNVVILSGLPILLAAMIISACCVVWVLSDGKGKELIE